MGEEGEKKGGARFVFAWEGQGWNRPGGGKEKKRQVESARGKMKKEEIGGDMARGGPLEGTAKRRENELMLKSAIKNWR